MDIRYYKIVSPMKRPFFSTSVPELVFWRFRGLSSEQYISSMRGEI